MSTMVSELVDVAEQRWLDHWRTGPTRLRWTELPPQIGDKAADLELVDRDGTPTRLSSYWRDQPALVMFWRHFACGCGLDRASRLAAEYEQYRAAGARPVIVGQGEPPRAAAYAERYGLPAEVPVLSDPSHTAYQRYGLVEGTPAQILYDAPEDVLRCDEAAGVALAESRRAAGRPMVDNPWLLPGEFVVDRSGQIRLAYRYQYCEDYPDPLVLVAAIGAANG